MPTSGNLADQSRATGSSMTSGQVTDELDVLASIYADEYSRLADCTLKNLPAEVKGQYQQLTAGVTEKQQVIHCRVQLSSHWSLHVYLPASYPQHHAPLYQILHTDAAGYTTAYTPLAATDHTVHSRIDIDVIHTHLMSIYTEKQGDVCLFDWLTWLIENKAEHGMIDDEQVEQAETQAAAGHGTPTKVADIDVDINPSPSKRSPSVVCPSVYSDTAQTIMKSTFQGHVATVTLLDEVNAVRQTLLTNKKIQRATHNIMAYRIRSDSGILLADNDDDGETAAGSNLAQLLEMLKVENVVVVVSRWYGGQLMGPQRFAVIKNIARQALEAAGLLKQ